jgi:lipoprotein signal peptidase
MPERSYRVILWVVAILGLAADQATKYGVFAWLWPGELEDASYLVFADSRRTVHDRFELIAQYQRDIQHRLILVNGRPVPHVNQGALFGIFRDHKELANAVFAGISLLAATAIIWWSYLRNTARDRWLCVALGLILAGTLGNLYDRALFLGVRDFLHWDYLFNWPVFNVADCCLVCGAILLTIQAFAPQSATAKAAHNPALASTAGHVRADLAVTNKG